MLAVQADGHEVTTVEGLGTASELDPVQEGFKEEHGLQCGFCTPGMMLAAKALLAENPDPTEDEVRFGALRQPVPLHRLPEHRQGGPLGRRQAARGDSRHDGHPGRSRSAGRSTRSRSAGWAPAASGSRTTASSAARATTSTTSCCPGMLHMEILRSPLAHARIKSIDTSAAYAIPGVRLVLTGEMMATRNLAWMPTLSYDTQAVLATDKVRFQGQEVACVIADDPYIAKDALRGDPGRVRAAAGDRQPDAGDGRGRADHPRRQGEPARQRLLHLGGRRPRRPPTGPSPRPTSSRSSSCTTRARTPRRWSAAARSPTSTGRRRSSPST